MGMVWMRGEEVGARGGGVEKIWCGPGQVGIRSLRKGRCAYRQCRQRKSFDGRVNFLLCVRAKILTILWQDVRSEFSIAEKYVRPRLLFYGKISAASQRTSRIAQRAYFGSSTHPGSHIRSQNPRFYLLHSHTLHALADTSLPVCAVTCRLSVSQKHSLPSASKQARNRHTSCELADQA